MNAKTLLAAVVVAGAALAGASQASAMPVGPQPAGNAIEQVRFGCGPGWHPNRWGRCVPNFRRYAPPPRRYYRRNWRHRRW